MTLVQSWIDSLSLLKPKNFKLFALVTLKSIIDAYKILGKYWWWLYAVVIGCFVLPYVQDVSFATYEYIEAVSYWAYQILLFAALVSTRPSLEQKNCAYFRSYMPYSLVMVPLLLIFSLHRRYWLPTLELILLFILAPLFMVWPFDMWLVALSPIYFFVILFYLDSSKKMNDFFMSCARAIKMVIYNYPLFICINILACLPIYILFRYIFFEPLLLNIIKATFLPIATCLYTNIYIKKVHDQFDLYFKQPN